MNLKLARASYSLLLRMHPAAFRERFGDEMLQVFDDAFESRGWVWLLADVAASLGRQRVLRPENGPEMATSRAGLLAGVYLDPWPPHLTSGKVATACLLSLLAVFLFPPREAIHHTRAAHYREVRHAATPRR